MPRILFISMPGVTHAAQWIGQLPTDEWDIHFFPSHDGANFLDSLQDLTIYSKEKVNYPVSDAKVKVKSLMPIRGYRAARIAKRLFPKYFDSARWLADTIDSVKPDLIHSMEMQKGAYLVEQARKYVKGTFPPWIVTPWGSDLYLYQNLSQHVDRLKSVLSHCDYFWAECQRDFQFAAELGFKGQTLAAVPASGGFPMKKFESIERTIPSKRKYIMLKGYQGFVGRALNALTAMKMCKKELEGYTVVLYLSCYEVDVAAELLAKSTGIKIETLRFPLPYELIQSYFAKSRIHIGMSISDGLPTTVIESMALGAFPIQSDSSCAHEWIKNGVTGLLVPADEPVAIAHAFRRALSDDALVDSAVSMNLETVREKFDYDLIRTKVLATYESVLSSIRARQSSTLPQKSSLEIIPS